MEKLRYNLYLLAFFTCVYLAIDMNKHYGVKKGFTSCVYVSCTTHTTTGFGDITPQTRFARWLTVAHMMSAYMILLL